MPVKISVVAEDKNAVLARLVDKFGRENRSKVAI
jgi:hypothetical protein